MNPFAELSPNLSWALGGIYATLATASGTTTALRRLRPGIDLDEVRLRIRSWWVMTTVFTIALVVHPLLSVGFFALVSFLAFREFAAMHPVLTTSRRLIATAMVAIAGQYLLIGLGDYGLFVLFVGLYVFLAIPIAGALGGTTAGFTVRTGTLMFGLFATTFTVGHAPMLLMLDGARSSPAGAAGLLVYLVVLTETNDVAQFLWGKALGRHKAAPEVSPGKTVEGLVGGVFTTLALGMLLSPWLTPFSLVVAAMVGAGIGLTGFLGDLSISAMKRDAGVKDAGSLLPGHGGVLDRIDSLMVTAPLFFHFFRYFYA